MGLAFACASIAVPACCRIWVRVRFAVSAAKSASRMRLRDADRFSAVVCRLAIADSKRFWYEPSTPRVETTWASAASTTASAEVALVEVVPVSVMALSAENALACVAVVKTSVFAPPSVIEPLPLSSET